MGKIHPDWCDGLHRVTVDGNPMTLQKFLPMPAGLRDETDYTIHLKESDLSELRAFFANFANKRPVLSQECAPAPGLPSPSVPSRCNAP